MGNGVCLGLENGISSLCNRNLYLSSIGIVSDNMPKLMAMGTCIRCPRILNLN